MDHPPVFTLSHPPPSLSKVVGPLLSHEETILLLSSDKVPFRIPTHQLASARSTKRPRTPNPSKYHTHRSPTFLSASSFTRTGQRQLRLSSAFETAAILTPFSELLLDAGLPTPRLLKLNVATATGLIRLLEKWECAALLRLALACIHHGYTTGAVKSWVVFMAACVAQDVDIVAAMLNNHNHGGWKREGLSRAADDLTLDIDVRGYPYEWWAMIAPRWQWAISKAMTYGDKYPQSVRGRGEVFRELLKPAAV
ncbi:unnamed protein product [Cutaneotrichosporon oleaginosum]